MIRRFSHIGLALSLLFFSACDLISSYQSDEEQGKPVARVYDSFLYDSDLVKVIPEDLNPADSSSFVQNYVNVWAKDQLMIYKAEFNLTDEEKQFEEQIRNYRNDLLKFAFLEKYVDDRLDTTITKAQIQAYYENNQDNFQLKENILRMRYISVPVDAPDIDVLKRLFRSRDSAKQEELVDYALSFARNFSLEDTSWISFNQFRRLIPIQAYNQQEFLAKNSYVELEVDNLLYLVTIAEYKIKDNTSPLLYVENIIRNILLNKRRLDLIAELEKNLLSDAIKKKEFETYSE